MSKTKIGILFGLVCLFFAPLLMLGMCSGPPPMPNLSAAGADNCSVPAPPGELGAQAVADHAYRAGFRGEDIEIAVAVARAESGWNAKATNLNGNSSVDYGLMQINSIHAAILAAGNWSDPGDNMIMAFKVWTDAGRSWNPWVTYWSGSYEKFLQPIDVQPVCTAPISSTCTAKDVSQYQNGLIPKDALCVLWADSRHRLNAKATPGFDAMSKAYEQQFGAGAMCLTDSYRSLAAQIDVRRRKPGLAAIPGTSNHGWGQAVDLCSPGGGQWVVGSDYDVWMHQHAGGFGWVHPDWAEPNGSKPEPWHWGLIDKEHRP